MGSYRHRENLVDGGGHFAILQPVCDHSQGKSLDLGYRLFSSLPVNHHSGELRNLRDPPAVVFALDLDEQVHWRPSHTLTRNDVRSQPGAAGPPCLGHSRSGGARNSSKECYTFSGQAWSFWSASACPRGPATNRASATARAGRQYWLDGFMRSGEKLF